MVEFCSIEYEFPDRAYIAIIWFIDKKDRLMTALSSQLHKNVDELESYARGLGRILENKKGNEVIEVSVFEIKKSKLISNKKEYWTAVSSDKKITDGTMSEKMNWLTNFLKSPKLYDLLVVPRMIVGGEMVFDMAKTFLKGEDNKEKIEDFMYWSNQVVDPRAKQSGIYEVSGMLTIDFKTGKRRKTYFPKIGDDELMD